MASIHKQLALAVPAEQVWDALRDVGALHTRLVPGFVVDTRLEEGARVVTFGDGTVAKEWIIDVDDERRRVAWAITDAPFAHYNASAQVLDGEQPGHCRFVWIADLLPHELKDGVASMMDQGLAAIERAMQKGAA